MVIVSVLSSLALFITRCSAEGPTVYSAATPQGAGGSAAGTGDTAGTGAGGNEVGGGSAGQSPGIGGTAGPVTGGNAGGGAAPAALCPMNNITQLCTCNQNGAEVRGRQVCSVLSGWGECQCDAAAGAGTGAPGVDDPGSFADLEINKGAPRFEWQRTMPSGGSCKAGHYEGTFDGNYVPAITFGFGTTEITGTISFDLEETGSGEIFEINSGYLTGWALDLFPFEGEITGTLDCATGFADGFLRNCSYIFFGLPAFFEGPALGLYDKFNHVFVEGVWAVTEVDLLGTYAPPPPIYPGDPLPPLPFAGGVGNWAATWTP